VDVFHKRYNPLPGGQFQAMSLAGLASLAVQKNTLKRETIRFFTLWERTYQPGGYPLFHLWKAGIIFLVQFKKMTHVY
jgi:hypothetical protein